MNTQTSTTTAAVQIRDVSFRYKRMTVLQNINLTVPRACIYALLGPSGSGKTTLLRLMLGRIKPEFGSISIFGHCKPGYYNRIIGYMPQSQALSPELTIGETMDYFASLHQIPVKKFAQIKIDLKSIFCLGSDELLVRNLSGGQQKALSLALVFMHSPKLVILDEPTVGTDPELGAQIWSYLRCHCNNGLTVIIVTHYIQEASLADRVGMMRNGRMIEEGTPKELYCKYNKTNLEEIFIKICTEKQPPKEMDVKLKSYQEDIVTFLSYQTITTDLVYGKDNGGGKSVTENDDDGVQMTLWAVLWLLFILIRRNIYKFLNSKMTSIMLFSPVFCTLLMCITFKVDKINLPAAVYNEDGRWPVTADGARYSDRFQEIVKNFSVYHLNYVPYETLEEAIQAVERGHAITALWFEKEFSPALVKRALASVNIYHDKLVDDDAVAQPLVVVNGTGNAADNQDEEEEEEEEEEVEGEEEDYTVSNKTLRGSTIKVYMDNSNMFYAQPVLDMIHYGSWDLLAGVIKDQGYHPITSTLHIQEVVYAEGTDTPDFLMSGYLIAFLYLSQVTLTSQLLIIERQDGFFDRAIVAGAKHSLMFFSHFFTNLIFSIVQISLMFLIGFVWYRLPNFGSYTLIVVLTFFQSTSSIMTGLLISAVCDANFSAFFISLSITLSQLFTSGAIFPIISFDPVIKFFLRITPIAMPVESLRNVMLRGWDLTHVNVLHGLLTNITITIVFGTLALVMFIKRS